MSRTDDSQNLVEEAFRDLQSEEFQEKLHKLADRDDELGAMGRVFQDLVNGERPSKADCREAGCPSIWEQFESEGIGR